MSPMKLNAMHSLMYSIFLFIFMIDIGFAIEIFNTDNGKIQHDVQQKTTHSM